MELIKGINDFVLKDINYEGMSLIVRGLKHETKRLQNNINLITVEIFSETCEEYILLKKSQIDYFTQLRNEIKKIINEYENN
jgi:hypothetical protein